MRAGKTIASAALAAIPIALVGVLVLGPTARGQQTVRKVDMGDYEPVFPWPQPLPDTDLSHAGWTWGSGAGVWAESPAARRLSRSAAWLGTRRDAPRNEVIVLAAKGTVMPMLGRRGEWLQVQISPEMRRTGMPMRGYKNEASGWVHDSMVEFVTPEPK